MGVNLYYLHSLNDWMAGSADRWIFVQEVVLQEHMLEMCYKSFEKSGSVVILKSEKHLYMSYNE